MSSLLTIIENNNLPQEKAVALQNQFSGFLSLAEEWKGKLNEIVITSPEQKEEMKKAREARIFLKAKRVEIEKTRKTLKEESLRESQGIDAVARFLTDMIKPLEEKAEQLERWAEIKAAEERAERLQEREKLLSSLDVAYNKDIIADMGEDMFNSYLEGIKKQAEAKKAEAERAELERIKKANEEAEARRKAEEERAELQKKLDAERAERAKAEEEARKEREELAKAAQLEREKREKIEEEARKKAAAERAERAKAEEEARRAKNAPDREKLAKLANDLAGYQTPDVTSEEGQKLISEVKTLLNKVAAHINSKLEKM